MKRRELIAMLATVASGVSPWSASAAAGDPVRMVIPYPPGGPTDTAARHLSESLARATGGVFVVDNRSGGGGSIGTAEVARARPDGRTLGVSLPDSLINVVFTLKNPGYRPLDDLTLIAQFASAAPLLIVDPGLKVRNMGELLAAAKAKPGTVSYGSWGPGSFPHLLMASIEQLSGTTILHVPYRGAQPALQDLIAKQVQIGFVPAHVAETYRDKGWGVPVAVAGPRRVDRFPEVATLAEQGYDSPMTRSTLWMGLFGPRGIDSTLVKRLAADVHAAVKTEAFVQSLAAMSHVPDYKGPEEFRESLRKEYDEVARLMKALGIQPA